MSFSNHRQSYQNLFCEIAISAISAIALALPTLALAATNATTITAAPTGRPLAIMGPVSGWRQLFNGTDLTGWESYLGAPLPTSNVPNAEKDAQGNYTKPLGLNNDPLHCFTVVTVDGAPAIRVSGEGYGVLGTKEDFSNYHLRFQFKRGEKSHAAARAGKPQPPKNGGMIYHAHGDYGVLQGRWMNALQYQICDGSCGAFIIQGDSTGVIKTRKGGNPKKPVYDPAGDPTTINLAVPECFPAENFEKPIGEWNTFEIVCVGDKAIHILNGHMVAFAEHLSRATKNADGATTTEPLTSGRIQIQMEGAEEYFRNIEIRPADETSVKYFDGK